MGRAAIHARLGRARRPYALGRYRDVRLLLDPVVSDANHGVVGTLSPEIMVDLHQMLGVAIVAEPPRDDATYSERRERALMCFQEVLKIRPHAKLDGLHPPEVGEVFKEARASLARSSKGAGRPSRR